MKGKTTSFLSILLGLTLLLSSWCLAEPMGVEEIINRANLASYYAGDDGRATINMTITDKQGRERKREFTLLRKDRKDGGEQFFFVYFKKPSDVRKMVFMVHKHIDTDDDRWLYLPALDLVKRIAASDKRTSFVGSNYLYEDVSGRGVDEDVHELIETTDKYYVVKNTPKNQESVEFSSYTVWIDKMNFLPMKTRYLDKNNKEYRIVEALEVQEFNGIPTVTVSKASDLSSGSSTLVEFRSVRYDIGLDEKIFTERYLRRPPREVRK
jgi:outer membrane lipoprotein-sorting protein